MPLPAMTHSSAFLLPASAPTSDAAAATTYALVVLNQRLPRFAPLLWARARLRVCADGGANRVFDGMPELLPGEDTAEVRARYKPDVIKGDMDSIRPEVKEYYSNLGTNIVDESHDQDTTDLHNCVFLLLVHLEEGSIMRWGTSMYYTASRTPRSSSCLMTVQSFCSPRHILMRSILRRRSKVLTVV